MRVLPILLLMKGLSNRHWDVIILQRKYSPILIIFAFFIHGLLYFKAHFNKSLSIFSNWSLTWLHSLLYLILYKLEISYGWHIVSLVHTQCILENILQFVSACLSIIHPSIHSIRANLCVMVYESSRTLPMLCLPLKNKSVI